MKVLIVEDEELASDHLAGLLRQCDIKIDEIVVKDSVSETVDFLKMHDKRPDLILLDIQLADGLSFEIFRQVDVTIPVIFITAFDDYAIDAFSLFSIDYLLKPITIKSLKQALDKFAKVRSHWTPVTTEFIEEMMNLRKWKERFLVKSGNRMFFREVSAIDHFYAEDKFCYLVDLPEGNKFMIDHTLDELEKLLNPHQFFRINRAVILNINAIKEIRKKTSSRLMIRTNNASPAEMIVSRSRTPNFRNWLQN